MSKDDKFVVSGKPEMGSRGVSVFVYYNKDGLASWLESLHLIKCSSSLSVQAR